MIPRNYHQDLSNLNLWSSNRNLKCICFDFLFGSFPENHWCYPRALWQQIHNEKILDESLSEISGLHLASRSFKTRVCAMHEIHQRSDNRNSKKTTAGNPSWRSFTSCKRRIHPEVASEEAVIDLTGRKSRPERKWK